LHITKKFKTKDRGVPKSAGPVAIATFATTVNQALGAKPTKAPVATGLLSCKILFVFPWYDLNILRWAGA